MSAAQLLSPEQAGQWLRVHVRADLCVDSRRVRPGDGFIAWPGAAHDARAFVAQALAAGAAVALIESEGAAPELLANPNVASYQGLKRDLGLIAAVFYGQASEQLWIVAVTGTNGKTSTAWWLSQLLSNKELQTSDWRRHVSQKVHQDHPNGLCGHVGTLGIGLPGTLVPSGLTTPDPVTLQRALAVMRKQGAWAVAMEASSIGIVEHRLGGVAIDCAVFTNFTQDHLDYHRTMGAYWQAKRALFDFPSLSSAVIHIDDPKGAQLAAELRTLRPELRIITTSLNQTVGASLVSRQISHTATGLRCEIVCGAEVATLEASITGEFNVANLLGVIGAAMCAGMEFQAAVSACARLSGVPGRLQLIGGMDEPMAVIDYAHTPDALEKALTASRSLARARGGQLHVVFGCGGNRDASKRPLMGAIAKRLADSVVVTSDNPRDESPEAIAQAVMAGAQAQSGPAALQLMVDRAQAIARTLRVAAPQDVVLIAGKGHEDYQEVLGVKHPFSDEAHARAALAARAEVVA